VRVLHACKNDHAAATIHATLRPQRNAPPLTGTLGAAPGPVLGQYLPARRGCALHGTAADRSVQAAELAGGRVPRRQPHWRRRGHCLGAHRVAHALFCRNSAAGSASAVTQRMGAGHWRVAARRAWRQWRRGDEPAGGVGFPGRPATVGAPAAAAQADQIGCLRARRGSRGAGAGGNGRGGAAAAARVVSGAGTPCGSHAGCHAPGCSSCMRRCALTCSRPIRTSA
jgi:hypothetical protein